MIQWIKYFLVGVAQTAKLATETLSKIISLKTEHESVIQTQFGKRIKTGLILHNYLLKQALVTVKEVQELCDLSAKAAGDLINTFVEKKMLKEFTGQFRNRIFAYEPYLELFND
jgi:Fic family protein